MYTKYKKYYNEPKTTNVSTDSSLTEISYLKTCIQKLEEQLEELTAKSTTEIAILHKAINDLEISLKDSRDTLRDKKAKITEETTAHETTRNENKSLVTHNAILERAHSTNLQKIVDLQEEHDKAHKANTAIQKKVTNLTMLMNNKPKKQAEKVAKINFKTKPPAPTTYAIARKNIKAAEFSPPYIESPAITLGPDDYPPPDTQYTASPESTNGNTVTEATEKNPQQKRNNQKRTVGIRNAQQYRNENN